MTKSSEPEFELQKSIDIPLDPVDEPLPRNGLGRLKVLGGLLMTGIVFWTGSVFGKYLDRYASGPEDGIMIVDDSSCSVIDGAGPKQVNGYKQMIRIINQTQGQLIGISVSVDEVSEGQIREPGLFTDGDVPVVLVQLDCVTPLPEGSVGGIVGEIN